MTASGGGGTFHDYTLASNGERLVAVLEAALSAWSQAGLQSILRAGASRGHRTPPSVVKVQVALKHRLKWRSEPYILSLHLPGYVLAEDHAVAAQPLPPQQEEEQQQHEEPPDTTGAAGSRDSPPPTAQQQAAQRLSSHALMSLSSTPGRAQPPHRGGSGARAGGEQHALLDGAAGSAVHRAVEEGGEAQDGQGLEGAGQAPGEWEVGVTLDMEAVLRNMEDIVNAGADEEGEGEDPDAVARARRQHASGSPARTAERGSTAAGRRHHASSDVGPAAGPAGERSQQEEARAWHGSSGAAAGEGTAASAQQQQQQQQHQQRQSSARAASLAPAPSPPAAAAAEAPWLAWWPHRAAYRPWWRYTHQHKLQQWFGLDHFVLLTPHSFSRRFLDETEARAVLSCLTAALANQGLAWPALLAVHDGLRDTYWGQVVVPGAQPQWGAGLVGGARLQLTTDSVSVSGPAAPLLTLQGQLRFLRQQLSGTAPSAAALCGAALQHAASPAALLGADPQPLPGAGPGPGVRLSARYTYRLPEPTTRPLPRRHAQRQAALLDVQTHDDVGQPASGRAVSSGGSSYAAGPQHWDEGEPWSAWASYPDPVQCVELDLVWDRLPLTPTSSSPPCAPLAPGGGHLGNAQAAAPASADTAAGVGAYERLLQPSAAHAWVVHALQRGLSDDPGAVLGFLGAERHRQHVRVTPEALQAPAPSWTWPLRPSEDSGGDTPHGAPPTLQTLHGMLSRLAALRPQLRGTATLIELASDSWWWDRSLVPGAASALPPVPSEALMASILADVWQPRAGHAGLAGVCGPPLGGCPTGEAGAPPLMGTAPAHSPLMRLALHALMCGNPRALAVLWARFTRSLRLDFWEAGVPLPLGGNDDEEEPGPPSLASPTTAAAAAAAGPAAAARVPAPLTGCLLHQKLRVLNACIQRLHRRHTPAHAHAQPHRSGSLSSQAAAAGGGASLAASRTQSREGAATAGAGVGGGARDGDGDDDEELLPLEVEAPGAAPWSPAADGAAAGGGGGVGGDADSYFSASEDEDALMVGSQGLAPRGVDVGAGRAQPARALAAHADRPMRAPLLQARPVWSVDRWVERGQQLLRLRALEGEAALEAATPERLGELLALEELASDMGAFKAANPGAVLQDFVAWQHMAGQRLHSTAAATSATPGPAPAVPAGWAHAWDVTAPCPAAEQKALQDPRLEGERVLHDLDTLTPGDALDSLAALGVAAAHALLGASGGATLTPVADLCQRFHRLAEGIVGASCRPQAAALAQGSVASSPARVQAAAGLLAGFQDHELEYLLDQLQYLEAVVVLGCSLNRRLPTCPGVCADLVAAVLQGTRARLLTSCQTHGASQLHEHVCRAECSSWAGKRALAALCCEEDEEGGGALAAMMRPASRAGGPDAVDGMDWPEPAQREWALTVDAAPGTGLPPSRMFVQHAGSQTRIALALASEE